MEKSFSNRIRSFVIKFPAFLKTYFGYLVISLSIWLLSIFLIKDTASSFIIEKIPEIEAVVNYSESKLFIILKAAITLGIIYFVMNLFSRFVYKKLGIIFYIVITVLVSLVSTKNWGGGLLTYTWGMTWITVILGQIEWFGGAMIASSGLYKQSRELLLIGFTLVFISAILTGLIL